MKIEDILDTVEKGEWVILSVTYGTHNASCNILVDRQRNVYSDELNIPVDPNMSRENMIRLVKLSKDGINGLRDVDVAVQRFHNMVWEL